MKTIRELLLSNRAWSLEMRERKADYFTQQTAGQRPEVFWIGCSDSRVSPEQITQTRPGELLIHRNTANLIHSADENLLADLQYAIDELQVPHIVLCGHHGCGGIMASLEGCATGPMQSWLSGVRAVEQAHHAELETIDPVEERVNRLAELNVRDQLIRLGRLDIVRRAFERGQELTLHGWVYDMRDGIISEMLEIGPDDELDDVRLPENVISIGNASRPAKAAGTQ